MYDWYRKKVRWHKRELRRVLAQLQRVKPAYVPREHFQDETVGLYANLFYRPHGAARKALLLALLRKTEEIIRQKPTDLPYCKVCLIVPEENVAQSTILLFFSPKEHSVFWDRTNITVQRWTRVEAPSLAGCAGVATTLPEQCYLEQVCNSEDKFQRKIWFYGEL